MLPCVAGFALSVWHQWRLHRHEGLQHQGWATALLFSVAQAGPRIGRVLLPAGMLYSGAQLAVAYRRLARGWLTSCGQIVLEYVD